MTVKEQVKKLLENNIKIIFRGKSFNFDHKVVKVDSLLLEKFNINDEDFMRVFPECGKTYNSWFDKYEYQIPYTFSELFVEEVLPLEFFFQPDTWDVLKVAPNIDNFLPDVLKAILRDRDEVLKMNSDEFLMWRLSV